MVKIIKTLLTLLEGLQLCFLRFLSSFPVVSLLVGFSKHPVAEESDVTRARSVSDEGNLNVGIVFNLAPFFYSNKRITKTI